MKQLLLLFLCFTFVEQIQAQDIIILKNGDEIKARVIEVLPDIIRYKKIENETGPLYSENKANVFMIKYQNGTKDVFEQQQVISPTPATNTEDIKKDKAIKSIEQYFVNLFSNMSSKVISFKNFRKTNGVMKNYFGQSVYEVEQLSSRTHQ